MQFKMPKLYLNVGLAFFEYFLRVQKIGWDVRALLEEKTYGWSIKKAEEEVGYSFRKQASENLLVNLNSSLRLDGSYTGFASGRERISYWDMKMVIGMEDLKYFSDKVWNMVVAHEWVHILCPASDSTYEITDEMAHDERPTEVFADKIAEELTGMSRKMYYVACEVRNWREMMDETKEVSYEV